MPALAPELAVAPSVPRGYCASELGPRWRRIRKTGSPLAALRFATNGREVVEWSGHLARLRDGNIVATRYSRGEGGTYWFDYDPGHAGTVDYVLLACGSDGLWFLFPRDVFDRLAARPDASHPSARPGVLTFSIDARRNTLTYGPNPAPKPFILRYRKGRLR